MKNNRLLIRIAIALIAFLIAMYLLNKLGYNSQESTKTQNTPQTNAIIIFEEDKE